METDEQAQEQGK